MIINKIARLQNRTNNNKYYTTSVINDGHPFLVNHIVDNKSKQIITPDNYNVTHSEKVLNFVTKQVGVDFKEKPIYIYTAEIRVKNITNRDESDKFLAKINECRDYKLGKDMDSIIKNSTGYINEALEKKGERIKIPHDKHETKQEYIERYKKDASEIFKDEKNSDKQND